MLNKEIQFNLASYTFIDVTGNDAHRFLQGQMTVDADSPKSNEAILAALCNPKGRIVSLFHISKTDRGYRLFLPKTIASQTQVHLKKYGVFFKVDILIADENLHLLVSNQSSTESIESIEIMGTPFSIVIMDTINEDCVKEVVWYQTLAENKIPWLTAETCEQFLPHNLNLPALNAIDFKKGCFTGQEVIARMQYKGKLKQRLQLLQGEQIIESESLKQTNKILQDDKKIGEVICSINHENKCLLLGLIKDSADQSETFQLENTENNLRMISS